MPYIERTRPGLYSGISSFGRICIRLSLHTRILTFTPSSLLYQSTSNGADGTVFELQVIAMLLPTDEGPPIRKADAQIDEPIRFASLDNSAIGIASLPNPGERNPLTNDHFLLTQFQGSRLSKLKHLIDRVQSDIPNVPQRRLYSSQSKIEIPNSKFYENRYLALATAKANEEFDPDPIYTYDLNGNRISMIDPTGLTTYNYDVLNRLTSITNNVGQTTTFTYDALGRRTSMTHDNGVVTNYTYDAASQLLSLLHQLGTTTINSFTYSYDKVGNRQSKIDNSGTAGYTYDSLNRLVEATNPLPSNPLESFTYDAVGNRTDSNQNGLSNFNDANQLLDDTTFAYTYDNNGNLTQKTRKSNNAFTLYEYDAENTLIRVVREDGSIVNYKYDGLGRRIEKEVDSVVTQYIYDNEDILLELDGSNNIVARYTHGPGIDEPLVVEKSGASSFYHADGLGSITELTDSVGTVVQSYAYSSFGKIESQLDPAFVQPYTFTAREFDTETDIYHYRARAYDPRIGRFLQEDPLKLGRREVSLYVYVSNNPLKFVDPAGLLNFVAGLGGSAVALTGVEGSAGVVINVDRGTTSDVAERVGVFGSLGAGAGVNVSGDRFIGIVKGSIQDVQGQTINQNFVIGPFSATLFINPQTGELVGGTVGRGPSATRIAGSTAIAVTGVLTIKDIVDFFRGIFEDSSELTSCN